MELETSHGFVYTLEAIIASSLVLGMAVFVIPTAVQDQEETFDSVEQGLQSLDERGLLDGSAQQIEDDLEPYIPEEYNYTVRLNLMEDRTGSVSSSRTLQLEDGYKKLLLWIDSANNLEIEYRGQNVLDSDETGYREVELGSSGGELNFSGSMDLDYRVQRFYSNGTVPQGGDIFSRSFIYSNEDGREVQVILWQ